MNEYKNLKIDVYSSKVNKKNKPILVRSEEGNLEKEFESIMHTIKFFET